MFTISVSPICDKENARPSNSGANTPQKSDAPAEKASGEGLFFIPVSGKKASRPAGAPVDTKGRWVKPAAEEAPMNAPPAMPARIQRRLFAAKKTDTTEVAEAKAAVEKPKPDPAARAAPKAAPKPVSKATAPARKPTVAVPAPTKASKAPAPGPAAPAQPPATERAVDLSMSIASKRGGQAAGTARHPKAKLVLVKPEPKAGQRAAVPMPYASKNTFYDELWIEKQERGFTEWLNFTFHDPSVEVELAEEGDAPTLAAYSRMKKLNAVRKQACALFQSREFEELIFKLEEEISCERLFIRPDRNLESDVGLQKYVTELLFNFNFVWLRLGLETIFGELIPMTRETAATVLGRFIKKRVVADAQIAAKYAGLTQGVFLEGYAKAVKQHTLKRVLFVLRFLDCAKQRQLIPGDPILFKKTATIKECREILLDFSKNLLGGIGDITRHLGHFNYHLTWKQNHLEEVDFSVANIAVDLRDGVRFGHLIDLMTRRTTLTKGMRLPAISLLQKVHNMDIVMEAIHAEGITTHDVRGGGIQSKDVVNGHREKTLTLLWKIILKWSLTSLIDPVALQAETRRIYAAYHGRPRRDSDVDVGLYFNEERLSALLKWCQAVCALYDVPVRNFTVSFADGRAFCYLIHHYHPALLPLSAIETKTTATLGEMKSARECQEEEAKEGEEGEEFAGTWMKTFSPTMGGELKAAVRGDKRNFRTLQHKLQDLGGIPHLVQTLDMTNAIPDEKVVITFLAYLSSRLLSLSVELRAASIIQNAWRVYKQGTKDAFKIGKAIVIQRAYRAYRERTFSERAAKAVVRLQRVARGFLARSRFGAIRAGIVAMQSAFRGRKARAAFEEEISAYRVLAAVDAFVARAVAQREENERAALVFCGSVAAVSNTVGCAVIACHDYIMSRWTMANASATVVQCAWRSFKAKTRLAARRKARDIYEAYVEKKEQEAVLAMRKRLRESRAACTIQRVWRGQHARHAYLNMRGAAVTLQSVWRGFASRKAYSARLRAIWAAVAVQKAFRGWVARARYQSTRKAAITFQAVTRGWAQRKSFNKLRASVLVIQSVFRGHLARQLASGMRVFNAQTHAATVFQAMVRGCFARKAYGITLATRYTAATKLAAAYRGYTARTAFLRTRAAVVAIQSIFRGRCARVLAASYRAACVRMQSFARMAICRARFVAQRKAAVAMQAAVRCFIARSAFLAAAAARRDAASTRIQTAFRMHAARTAYVKSRRMAVVVQAWYRRHSARSSFLRLCAAVRKVQITWRRFAVRQRVRREVRAKVVARLRAAVRVQTAWRSYTARKAFLHTKAAAVVVQSVVRMHQARSAFAYQRVAAAKIQSAFRAHVARVQARIARHGAISERTAAAVAIQSAWRGRCAARSFGALKIAAMCFQRTFRTRCQRASFVAARSAATVIQGAFRRHAARVKARAVRSVEIGARNKAATAIQARFRAHAARGSFVKMRHAAVTLQAVMRSHAASKRYTAFRTSVSVVQRAVRHYFARAHCYAAMSRMRSAATKLAAFARMAAARKSFAALRGATVTLQAASRAILARKAFLRTRNATMAIQGAFRRHAARSSARSERAAVFAERVRAAVVFQSLVRMRSQQRSYHSTRKAMVLLQACVRRFLARREYKRVGEAARNVQIALRRRNATRSARTVRAAMITERNVAAQRLQAAIRGRAQRAKFTQIRHAAVMLQAIARGRAARSDYTVARKSIVRVQSLVRGWAVRKAVGEQRAACVVVQAGVRGFFARKRFASVKSLVTRIAALWRGKAARGAFATTRSAVITLQSSFRGMRDRKQFRTLCALKTRLRGEQIASFARRATESLAAIRIQRVVRHHRVRALALARLDCVVRIQHWARGRLARTAFLTFRKKVVVAQRAVRAHLASRALSATRIQAVVRGRIARKRLARLVRVVVSVQTLWRGFRVRKESSKKLQDLRERVKATAANVDESMKLGNRTRAGLDVLLNSKQLACVLKACTHLNVSTRLSAICCERLVFHNAVPIVFSLIKSCNRSKPHMELLKVSVEILINLARVPTTVAAVFDCPDSIDIIVELMQMYRDKEEIFLRALELLRIICEDDARAVAVRNMHDVTKRMEGILGLLTRKVGLEMKAQIRKSMAGPPPARASRASMAPPAASAKKAAMAPPAARAGPRGKENVPEGQRSVEMLTALFDRLRLR